MPRESWGPVKDLIHVYSGFAHTEILIFRLYLLYFSYRHNDDLVKWFNLAKHINQSRKVKLFANFKYLFSSLSMSAAIIFISNCVNKLAFERCTISDYLVNILWLLVNLFMLRFSRFIFPDAM